MENFSDNDTPRHIGIPVTDLNPLNEWLYTPNDSEPFFSSRIFQNSASLIISKIDIFSLLLTVIMEWNSSHRVTSSLNRPVFIRGDVCPSTSPLLEKLQDPPDKFGICQVKALTKNEFQDFPVHLTNSPYPNTVIFRWCIVNKEKAPWENQGHKCSRLEKTLDATGHKPALIVLDNFSWTGSVLELKNMLLQMKNNGISVIILTSKLPPNNFASHGVWDNVIKITPWRTWRCSPYNIVLRFLKKDGLKTNIRYHLDSDNGLYWHEKKDSYDYLKPVIVDLMRDGKTALQIVDLINNNLNLAGRLKRPMTTSNLARLKREWGLRSYKPEKKPRKTKVKNQSLNVSLSEQM